MSTTDQAIKALYDIGERERKKVLGEAHVNKSLAGVSEFAQAGQELVTAIGWGAIWSRPGLSHKQRSLASLSILAALGKQTELSAHVKGALNNGITEEELKEVFMQIMVYAGAPAGIEAFRTADAAIKQWKAEHQ
ncbi:CMD-domain-containing protein [Irpex rosettiformis]|uniref:CMD-domain-containing protein n=1 Tax=Irpex rosettiformis TaxID=378272 RepID=A0ACB8U2I8_9APHY|nr:CMD-domain-containing protein [Irpex rosettiformis]